MDCLVPSPSLGFIVGLYVRHFNIQSVADVIKNCCSVVILGVLD
jgi:hypothetical protein